MQIEVPEGCALTLYLSNQGVSPEGSASVKAECACGEWEELIKDIPVQDAETQARSSWLNQHLLKTSQPNPPESDA